MSAQGFPQQSWQSVLCWLTSPVSTGMCYLRFLYRYHDLTGCPVMCTLDLSAYNSETKIWQLPYVLPFVLQLVTSHTCGARSHQVRMKLYVMCVAPKWLPVILARSCPALCGTTARPLELASVFFVRQLALGNFQSFAHVPSWTKNGEGWNKHEYWNIWQNNMAYRSVIFRSEFL